MALSNHKLNYLSGILLTVFLFYMVSCHKTPVSENSEFRPEPAVKTLDPQTIKEASGIADSRINQGFFWVQEDSGNQPGIHLVSHDGKVRKTIIIANTSNRDWEDICLAGGPDASLDYVYLADIGDNGNSHTESYIYRFPEPSLTVDTVQRISKIRYRYADGPRDSEALLVDDQRKEIYIISKRDSASRIYRLKAGYSESAVNTAEYVASLPYNGVVSAAVSPDKKDILLKTYSAIYHYKVGKEQSFAEALTGQPLPVTYQVEPQGEAVSFLNDNTGFLTLSEQAFATSVRLYQYSRK